MVNLLIFILLLHLIAFLKLELCLLVPSIQYVIMCYYLIYFIMVCAKVVSCILLLSNHNQFCYLLCFCSYRYFSLLVLMCISTHKHFPIWDQSPSIHSLVYSLSTYMFAALACADGITDFFHCIIQGGPRLSVGS